MHQEGHFGLALVGYAPIAYVLLSIESYALVVIGAALTAALSSAPDLDLRLPVFSHRGFTHTVWFSLLIGLAAGGAGYLIFSSADLVFFALSPVRVGILCAVVATVTILTHLLGDIITPMGLRPLAPLSRKKYTLDLVKAKSPIANYGFLVLGFLSLAAVIGATQPI